MRLLLSQAAEVRLGRQRAPQYEVGDHQVPYLRSANVLDGCLDLGDVKSMNFTPAEQAIFALEPGDVLMTEGSGSAETVGTSAVWQDQLSPPVCFQNTLLRLRPRAGVTDGRYLAWWARHAHGSGQLAAFSSGANIQHLGSDGLKRLQIDVPPLAEQWRIADFLDDRVARIDRIIVARRQQQDLLENRLLAQIRQGVAGVLDERQVTASSPIPWLEKMSCEARVAKLARVLTMQRGVDLTADEQRPGNVPVITTAGVTGWHNVAIATGPGVVIGRYGSVGSVHWVEGEYWPHNTTLYLKDAHGNSLRWAYYLLRSFPYAALQARAAVPGVNRNDMAAEDVPIIPRPLQAQVADVLDARVMDAAQGNAAVAGSIELLTEYKQSLITAAVTGELDVTTGGSGIPG